MDSEPRINNKTQAWLAAPDGLLTRFWRLLPGVGLSLVVAIVAWWLGRRMPLVGAPIFAILIGIVFSNVQRRGIPEQFADGVRFGGKTILKTAIVLLGAGLTLQSIWATGSSSFGVLLTTLAVGLFGALILGRFMGVPYRVGSLIAAGTAICGASAIAAIAPIITAGSLEVAYAISTVFLFNVIAVFAFPLLGHLFHFSNAAFGLWAGTAINDTSSVVAAGYAFSSAAGAIATVVKLTRTTMIVPVALGFAAIEGRRRARGSAIDSATNNTVRMTSLIPWFIVWFLVAALLTSVGIIPSPEAHWLSGAGKFLIVVALASVGLGTHLKSLSKTGYKPLALGFATWILVAVTSLVMQHLLGQL